MGTWRFHNVTTNADFWPLLDSISVVNQQPCALATFTGRIVGSDDLSEEDEVQVLYAADDITFATIFAGNVSVFTEAHIEPIAEPAVYEFSAQDFTALLDKTGQGTLGNRTVTESITNRVTWIMGQGNDFGITTTGVDSIATLIGPFDYRSMSKQAALAQVAAVAGAVYYVNADKDLQFYLADTVIAAPFELSTPASPPTSYPYRGFRRVKDVTDRADEVVAYNSDLTQFVVRTRVGAPSASLRKRTALATDLVSDTDLAAAADIELERIGTPQQMASLVCWQPGLASGQTVHITNPTHSIDDDFVISEVRATYLDTNPQEVGGAGGDAEFTISVSDRLLCIPQITQARSGASTPDCNDTSPFLLALPTDMTSNLSMARGQAGMHIYAPGVDHLVAVSCAGQLVRENDAVASGFVQYLRHEPSIYTGLLLGDRVLYLDPTLGAYGDVRWALNYNVEAADVMDVRKAWLALNLPGGWIVTRDTGAEPDISCDGDDLLFSATSAETWIELHSPSGGPWAGGADFDMLVSGFMFSAFCDAVLSFALGDAGSDAPKVAINISRSPDEVYITVDGKVTFQTSADLGLAINTRYNFRWQHKPSLGYSRARLWLASGSEPGTWNATRDPSADDPASSTDLVVFIQNNDAGAAIAIRAGNLSFDGTTYDNFARTTTSPDMGGPSGDASTTALQSRSLVDGSLVDSDGLDNGYSHTIRRTPNGQHVFVEGEGTTLFRYSKGCVLEDTITIADWGDGWDDWNVANDYTIYRLKDGHLFAYATDGSLIYDFDLQTDYDYYFASNAQGYGQQLVTAADGYIRAAGQKGSNPATSKGQVLTIDRLSGTVINEHLFEGSASADGGGGQVIALAQHGVGWWACGVDNSVAPWVVGRIPGL